MLLNPLPDSIWIVPDGAPEPDCLDAAGLGDVPERLLANTQNLGRLPRSEQVSRDHLAEYTLGRHQGKSVRLSDVTIFTGLTADQSRSCPDGSGSCASWPTRS